jgi:hypothetical protein
MPTPLGLLPLYHLLDGQYIQEKKQPNAPKKSINNQKNITNQEMDELCKSSRTVADAIEAEQIILR